LGKKFKIPQWLVTLLSVVVLFGGCTIASVPLWEWQDRRATHPVKDSERSFFPLLAIKDGKYVVTGQRAAEGATVVTSISRRDEQKINRDLCGLLPFKDYYYPWFTVLEEKDGVVRVSLEAPTGKESKRMGWYSLKEGVITMEQILYYGPGFAYIVLPWSMAAGIIALVVFRVGVWMLQRRSKVCAPELRTA
jgi:hypothetical protein